MKERKLGEAPLNRIPIYDWEGNMRGHVGKTATQATVARFLNKHGATLGKKNGRDAWLGPEPPPKPKPKPKPIPKPAQNAMEASGAGGGPSQTLEISLRTAKGSASSPPSKEAEAKRSSG